jgi:hypothetical protein
MTSLRLQGKLYLLQLYRIVFVIHGVMLLFGVHNHCDFMYPLFKEDISISHCRLIACHSQVIGEVN